MHQQLMLSKTNNKVIAIEYFKHEGYHNVNCITKKLGIEITEARGDEDVFPSSSLLREYVSLERCEPTQWFNNHKGFTFFSDEPHHKGLVHLPLSNPSRRKSGAFQQRSGAQPTTGLGAPEQLQVTTQGSQPPHGRLGSKDPRVTSSQAFNFHESSWRAQTDAMKQWQEHKCSNPSLSNPTTRN